MTTIPEEAVFAAAKAITGPLRDPTEWELMQFKLAITAALPHLPRVGVKKLEWELVSGDHYAEGAGTHYNIYETKPGLWNSVTVKPGNVRLATNVGLEAAKSAAQSDYEARILSALEPSAARDLALEEGFRQGVEAAANRCELSATLSQEQQDKESNPFIRNALMGEIATAKALAKNIRALSSPDHAGAGKVEGDGWLPIESAPKNKAIQIYIPNADYYGNDGIYAGILVDLGTGQRWATFGWAVARDLPPHMHPTHWRPLPSAPSQEAAGS